MREYSWLTYLLLVAFGALAVLVGCAPPGDGGGSQGDGNTVTGSVVDASDPNTGVGDAYVYVVPRGGTRSLVRGSLRQTAGASATTDANGNYTLTNVPAGLQKIAIEPPSDSDYPPFDLEVEVSADRATEVRATQPDAVTAARVAELRLSPAQSSIATGGTQQFTAQVLDAGGTALAVTPTWIALGGVGSVDEDGLFTAGDVSGRGFVMALLAGRVALAGVAVGGVATNTAPVITSLTASPGQRVHGGDTVSLDCVASDPDGDSLTWSWLATGASVDGGGASVTWTAPDKPGRYSVTCIVRDGGGSARESLLLWVLPPLAENGRIAFTSSRSDRTEVWVMEHDGSNQVAVSQYPAQHPDISPDGRLIAYSYQYQIWMVRTDGAQQEARIIGGRFEEPDWAPVANLLVLRSDALLEGSSAIAIAGPQGLAVHSITEGSHSDRSPRWSPDGLRIAFVSDRDGNDEIYVVYINGADPVRLTDSGSQDKAPTWSPDGSSIAFASNRDGNFEVYAVDADGSSPTNLTRDPSDDVDPCYSPDGTKLVFVSTRSETGELQIFTMSTDGASVEQLTTSVGNNTQPSWGRAP